MKIFNKNQLYELDKLTVERQNISGTDLMEQAGTEVFNWIHLRIQGAQIPIHVFCGIGNNGGDGLVIARHLITHGYNVNTYIVNYSEKRSEDFLINYDRIKTVSNDWPIIIDDDKNLPGISADDIIIDAIFGIGLKGAVQDWVATLFRHLRVSKAYTLSVDMPSGLFMDKVPEDENAVVWANQTLTFGAAKLVFLLPNTARFTQQFEVIDIGFDQDYIRTTPVVSEITGKYQMLSIYKPRKKYSHKGSFGHTLVIGGSYGKVGAVVLSSHAALVSGAGLVTGFIPKCGYQILQTRLPEVMVVTDQEHEYISKISVDFEPSSIGIGIGIGTKKETIIAFSEFIKTNTRPLVIDADALNILSQNTFLLKHLNSQTILTPHPKELERLIGKWEDDFDKLDKTRVLSQKYDLIIVIKGANTITVYKDKQYINTTGNPGLATAGSGDVLTGVIAGLLSQGYEPLNAALFGVYLHGKSADIAVEDFGYQGLTASYVIDYLGKAYLDLIKQPDQSPEAEEQD